MHYYQHNIADYRKDTTHLSLLEHGVYRQLLDWAYLEQTPIPKETKVVFRRLRAITELEQQAVIDCLNEFFLLTDDGYVQDRVLREIVAYEAKAGRAKENGKLGGRPLKTKVVISGNPDETQSKANSLTHKPINSLNNTEESASALQPAVVPDQAIAPKRARLQKKQAEVEADALPLLVGVNPTRLLQYLRIRTEKKPSPTPLNWTRMAVEGVIREAGVAGITLDDAVRECAERGWTGFRASWLDEARKTSFGKTTAGKHTGFEKLDYRKGIEDDGSFT